MDFAFNEQQEMLQTSARDFLSKEYPDKLLRQMAQDEKGYTHELWNKMAELGWTALAIPEASGGIGDFLDLIAILEEMGKVCLISPFFSTMVLGSTAISEAGDDKQKKELLSAIAEGKLIITLALLEQNAGYTADSINVKAAREKSGFVIQGTKLFVTDANSADYLICAARTNISANPQDGITLFLVPAKNPGISYKPLPTMSGEKQFEVVFDNVTVPQENILGTVDKGWQYLEKILAKAAIARCAEMIGGAERVLDMTLSYAKERIAFGHPIGSFQSIQHRCADMLSDLESSKYITHQAAWRLNEGLPAEKEVAIAKAWVNQALKRVVTSAHQVHGAIGFTEDHILHFYTKRIRAQEFSFGSVDYHLDRLADLVFQK